MNDSEQKAEKPTSASVPEAADASTLTVKRPAGPVKRVYVEKYEVAVTDDGCSWVKLVTGWQDEHNWLDGRNEVGTIPIRFSRDMREMARDLAWMLNHARGERIAQGNYIPVA